jgi:hypothetical protein
MSRINATTGVIMHRINTYRKKIYKTWKGEIGFTLTPGVHAPEHLPQLLGLNISALR